MISNIRPIPESGTKFRMVGSEHLDKDGNLKPGREDKPYMVTFVGLTPSKKQAMFTLDDDEEQERKMFSVESPNHKVELASGGRRRRGRTLRRKRTGKTRRGGADLETAFKTFLPTSWDVTGTRHDEARGRLRQIERENAEPTNADIIALIKNQGKNVVDDGERVCADIPEGMTSVMKQELAGGKAGREFKLTFNDETNRMCMVLPSKRTGGTRRRGRKH